jgi:hypothetical protein
MKYRITIYSQNGTLIKEFKSIKNFEIYKHFMYIELSNNENIRISLNNIWIVEEFNKE